MSRNRPFFAYVAEVIQFYAKFTLYRPPLHKAITHVVVSSQICILCNNEGVTASHSLVSFAHVLISRAICLICQLRHLPCHVPFRLFFLPVHCRWHSFFYILFFVFIISIDLVLIFLWFFRMRWANREEASGFFNPFWTQLFPTWTLNLHEIKFMIGIY